MAVWLLIITIMVARLRIANNYIIGMASKYASYLGTISGEISTKRKQKRITAESRVKLLEALAENVPFASKIIGYLREQGTSDAELFSMMTDPDALRGIKAISDTFGGVVEGITGYLEGRVDKKEESDDYAYLKSQ